MTKEDAIKELSYIADEMPSMVCRDWKVAIYMAIKVLKQEPTIDKIKAEINGMYRVILRDTPEDDWAVKWNDCLDEVLQIIDKYREGEETDI